MGKEILQRALKGEKLYDLHIIDSHCHIGQWHEFYYPKANIEKMIETADVIGIKKLTISPFASCDYKLGNKLMADAIEKFPERLFGLMMLNPNMLSEVQSEFYKYYSIKQVIGVKIHPSNHWYKISGENYYHIFDKVKQCRGYILTHTREGNAACSIDACEQVIKDNPDIAFVLAHGGGTNEGIKKSIRVVNKYENAYMDTCGLEVPSDTWIENIADKVDSTKVFAGSDCSYYDIRIGISKVIFADIEDEIKIKFLSRNFRNMISKYGKS